MKRHLPAALAATVAVVITVLTVETATAAPGPGSGMCQYLGSQYPVYYPCDEYQPRLPWGPPGNPPAGHEPFGVPPPGGAVTTQR